MVWGKLPAWWAKPLPTIAQGAGGPFPDRCHRLGLAGPCASSEPQGIARRHERARRCPAFARIRVNGPRRGQPVSRSGTRHWARCSTSSLLRPCDPLISDAAQAQLYKKVFEALRPGATLGLSHGFLLGYLETTGEKFPSNVNGHRCVSQGNGAVGAPSVRAGSGPERRRDKTRASPSSRTSKGAPPTSRWRGRLPSARRTRSRRR